MSKLAKDICHLKGPIIPTRFPTKFNAIRSAWNQKILLPDGLNHNPTPAAPSPLETPNAFLPKSDIRTVRRYQTASPVSQMPLVSPLQMQPRAKLTKEDCETIQRLRMTEPEKWNPKTLSRKFNVSERVICMVSHARQHRNNEMASRLAQIKSMWPKKKIISRAVSQAKKEAWKRDA